MILVEYLTWVSGICIQDKKVHGLSMAIKELKEPSPIWGTAVPFGMEKTFPDIRYGIY